MTNNNPESQQECCEKCVYKRRGFDGIPDADLPCIGKDCPCHTPAPSQSVGWEEELERIGFDKVYTKDGKTWLNHEDIKSFIRSLLASARADERSKFADSIEGIREDERARVVDDVRNYFERWRRNKSKKFESAVNSEAEARAVEMFLDLVKELDKAKTRVTHALEAGLQEGVNNK